MTTASPPVAPVRAVSLVRRLPADETAPGMAREAVRGFLRGTATADDTETAVPLATEDDTATAVLLVSELVTNSVTASAGMKGAYVSLSLRAVSTHLFVRVIDSAPGFPEVAKPELGDEHGYGLFVVREMSARYGWFRMNGGRKCTFFLLYLDDDTEGDGQ
jgi:anti-sigma regulatory factor (Ser/Thr protein kinase)